MSTKLVREILKTTKQLNALVLEYRNGEGAERLRCGIEVNRLGPLQKLQVEIVRNLPDLKLPGWKSYRRSRGIVV